MAAVTICSDFGPQENSLSLFPLFPHLFAMKWWDQTPWYSFVQCWVLSQFFQSLLSTASRGSLVLHFLHKGDVCHLHIWGYWYFSHQSRFQLAFHPAWHFSWCTLHWAFLVAQLVKNPPAVRETWVQSLGRQDALEKGKTTQSSTGAWRITWTI